MHLATPAEELADRLIEAGPPALFLDFDGTLVELAATPDGIAPSPRLVPLLTGLQAALGGGLAIVTGRAIARIDDFLAPLRLPVAGLHGFEIRLDPAGSTAAAPAAELDPVRKSAVDLPRAWPGVEIEDKGATLAIHYRAVPEAGPAVLARAQALVAASGGHLALIDGKMVAELLPRGRDKGTGIATLMARAPFAGRRPAFLGDDVTDEAGFAAVNGAGGTSVRIGAPAQPTEARFHLPGVPAVLDLLEGLLARLDPRLRP
jgi:trehalose 6-phosphate phosphatase